MTGTRTASPEARPQTRGRRLWVGWADAVTHQEQYSLLGNALRVFTGARRQAGALRHLPMAAVDELCQGRAPWFGEFATHRDPAGPFWAPMQLSAALDRVQVPVLLQGGWLGQHLAGTGTWMRATPVRLFVTGTGLGTGGGQWRDLRTGPPAGQDHIFYPVPDGQLSADPVAHRFAAGNRVRLLVAGGSFPRWERNLGTGEAAGTSVAMAPSHHRIDLAGSALWLPSVTGET